MRHVTTVFLSSTAKDLQPYRDAVFQAILKLDCYKCVRMEDFGPREGAPAVVCEKEVAEADVFVGLIGHLHGSCPEGSDRSFTEGEYEAAVKAGKPVRIFLAGEDFSYPGKLREPQEAWERQQRFRERVGREQVVEIFDDPRGLATSVVTALHRLHTESAGQRSAPGMPASPLGPAEAALRTAYLNRLLEQTGFLSLSGIDPAVANEKDTRLQLGAVYTALLTRGMLKTLDGSRPFSALEVLDSYERLVLLGD
ncbi:MAG TPA: DUF4062 domain-containing protein, partial [Thermoanaerobaculia bacterium]|nr:DUF4062 domain-containing protein [Thermoanaerobaculia bacterium]